MNRIFKMAMKDLKLLSRDKLGAFFIVGFPILMGLFFGSIMGGGMSSSGSSSKMEVAIVDQDQSEMSKKFVASLRANDSVDLVDDEFESAKESVRKGQRVAMVVLDQGFGETAGVFWKEAPTIRIGVDPSRNAESAMLQGFVMESIGQLASTRFQNAGEMKRMVDDSRKQLDADQTISAPQRLLVSTFLGSLETMVDNIDALQTESDETMEDPRGGNGFQFANIESLDISRQKKKGTSLKSQWDISFPQAMLWGVLGCVAGFAISIAKERSEGTLTRLQVAPVSKFEILAGKALACFMTTIFVLVMMTGIGLGLGMKPGNFGHLILAGLCVAFCFVGIMMVMANLGKTEQAVSGSGWAINMVMAMFGGCMIPVMFMPGFIKTFSNLSPVKWSIQALEGAIWREFTLAEMAFPCVVLVGIGAVGLVTGTLMLKRST